MKIELGGFLDELRKSVLELYRDKYFPVVFLVVGALGAALLNQWILVLVGVGGFLYFQFFKKDR